MIDLDPATGVQHGGMTLRFAYTVQGHDTLTNRNDVDTDGLWVQTGGSDKVVFLVGRTPPSPARRPAPPRT